MRTNFCLQQRQLQDNERPKMDENNSNMQHNVNTKTWNNNCMWTSPVRNGAAQHMNSKHCVLAATKRTKTNRPTLKLCAGVMRSCASICPSSWCNDTAMAWSYYTAGYIFIIANEFKKNGKHNLQWSLALHTVLTHLPWPRTGKQNLTAYFFSSLRTNPFLAHELKPYAPP